ncbi:hypothetical protein ILP97_39605 [Amycolatopsis sp. H6(2020)]|nr:hypothetical protein [Amycolatopsis sp. H6(2020)]
MTVTESKLLTDSVLGITREVDIVIEGEVDGEPIVISVEVIEHGRRASVNWVQQMIRKHLYLPTNRLLLVSKSGFSQPAMIAVEREGGRVQALTPEVIQVDGQAVVKSLYVDTITYSATDCDVHVRFDGYRTVVRGQPDTDIYAEDGTLVGMLAHLAYEAIHLDTVSTSLSKLAHDHPEREDVTKFSVELSISQLGYHLKHTESDTLHHIEALEIHGDFAWRQAEVPLALANLGGRKYGVAEVVIADRPTVWVGTTDLSAQTTTISWRTTDTTGPHQPSRPFQPTHFTDLLTLNPTLECTPDSTDPAGTPRPPQGA